MTARSTLIVAGVLALSAGGCTAVNVVPPGYNTGQYKTPADVAATDLSFIPPTDPRYSETGAPHVGEPTGISVAGDPKLVGDGKSYAPISERYRFR